MSTPASILITTPTTVSDENNTPESSLAHASPNVLQSLVTGPRLRFDSWSPDSQWIAYWSADGDDMSANLAFINVSTRDVCQQEDVVSDNLESGDVSWEEDGNVIVVQNGSGNAFRGMPCDAFSPMEQISISNTQSLICPDGRYLAETTISGWEGELIHNVTTVTEISTGEVVTTLEWEGSPHVWAESGWLTNELFLAGLDIYRGPLYVSVSDGRVGNLVSDHLGLDVQDVGYISRVGRYTDVTKEEYHLLIERSKNGPLPLLLYHSELDMVEELPFNLSWLQNGRMFSPDGKWLLLFQPSLQQIETDEVSVLSVDPPASTAVPILKGGGLSGFGLPSEGDRLAFTQSSILHVINFPEGEVVGRWRTPGYYTDRLWWSPDGNYVVVQGFSSNTGPEALFLIEP